MYSIYFLIDFYFFLPMPTRSSLWDFNILSGLRFLPRKPRVNNNNALIYLKFTYKVSNAKYSESKLHRIQYSVTIFFFVPIQSGKYLTEPYLAVDRVLTSPKIDKVEAMRSSSKSE